ncbi:hypothetical protein DFP72DRAFT_911258 [Ephemerocybe angulata]|uniref:Uncharacterized protein n=1 Tax=Ephemerocybe angulata TaxID=980116 RepID=A0A8H6HN61_9AGAR|nr:hypothetical protein DFP72DRAFT_911258 [Tulosesus angulatus]
MASYKNGVHVRLYSITIIHHYQHHSHLSTTMVRKSRKQAIPRSVARSSSRSFRLSGVSTLSGFSAMLYDASDIYASPISVPTLTSKVSNMQFPCFEALIGVNNHECVVSILDGSRRERKFLLVCQLDPHHPQNKIITRLRPNSEGWKGSILVMKMGVRSSFVHLNKEDHGIAWGAVQKFLDTLQRPCSLPIIL